MKSLSIDTQRELVEALEKAETAIDDCLSYRSHLSFQARDVVRAALAKARAEMGGET